eukprot:3939586-Rhodomonas_salina.3
MGDKLPIISPVGTAKADANAPVPKEATDTLRNTNVVQELLTGVNSSMFIVSFGMALYLAHQELRFGAVAVANVALIVLM